MRRSSIHPAVSASLIHEVRMIFESFFRNRSNESFWGGRKESTALKCVHCMRQRRKHVLKAVTLLNGNATCQMHFDFGENFGQSPSGS